MESVTTYDRVLAALRSDILDGRHPPGARLREVELAERYGVSRIPLREALRTLGAEGLLEGAPNRGVTVRRLDRKDIDDLFALRLALERLTASAAARSRVDLRGRVAERRARVARKLDAQTMPDAIAEDRGFHSDLAAASENRHAIEALGARWTLISRAMRIYISALTYPTFVWDEHAEIAEAIADGDSNRAELLMTEHITLSRDIVLVRIDELVSQSE